VRARFTARARGPKALVSDERESYTPGAENAGLEHQLGLAHWRKAVARRRKPVEDYETEQQLLETARRMLTLDILEKASGIPLGGDGLPEGLEPAGLLSTGTRTAAR